VEPTYESLAVIYLPEKRTEKGSERRARMRRNMIKRMIPKSVRENFDITEEYNDDDADDETAVEIKIYQNVAMANVLACLPKSKLVFKPSDAVRLDLISLITLIAIFATNKYDGLLYDILAFASVTFWVIRTVLKYINQQARYDLLVNKFLAKSMLFRGLENCARHLSEKEAEVRAVRAALAYDHLVKGEGRSNSSKEEISAGVEDLRRLDLVGLSDSVIVGAEVYSTLRRKWVEQLEVGGGYDYDVLEE